MKTRTFCTLSDYGYLSKGLVLYESLLRHSAGNFNLYYLCLDEKSYDTLRKLNLKSIIPLPKEEIGNLAYATKDYRSYCYTLSSRLCSYLMNSKKIDDILYIDSDIIFYYDFEKIYDEIGDKSIGVVPHWHNQKGSRSGIYNVGVVYFKGDKDGRDCLSLWNSCVLNPDNPYKKEYGTCYDQRYLELFEVKFPKSFCVIQDKIVQVASWNFHLFSYNKFTKEDMRVVLKSTNKEFLIVFIHFNRFVLDFKNNTYKFCQRMDKNKEYKYLYTPDSYEILEIKRLCDEYYTLNKEITNRYSL